MIGKTKAVSQLREVILPQRLAAFLYLKSAMLTVEQLRKMDLATAELTDEELLQLGNDYSGIAQLAFEDWLENKLGSRNLKKVLPELAHDL